MFAIDEVIFKFLLMINISFKLNVYLIDINSSVKSFY